MHSFQELYEQFEQYFAKHHFPDQPSSLYEPCSYLLSIGGKRVRPVMCLMSHELFAELNEDVWNTAMAIELFHNFTLMHDDIMDKAPLRRGMQTVHEKYSLSTAILSGDVLNIFSYVHLNKISAEKIHAVISLFNKTAIEICEGQQYDMDFESENYVSVSQYMHMITLKTSVLLGASMKLGALLGGATDGCSDILYEFGKNLGLAFQLKDDYLDAFGDASKTGKQVGGDILSNKKTFLITKAYELANDNQKHRLTELLTIQHPEDKLEGVLGILDELNIKNLLEQEIKNYSDLAFNNLEKAPVLSKRKAHLHALAEMLLNREY